MAATEAGETEATKMAAVRAAAEAKVRAAVRVVVG